MTRLPRMTGKELKNILLRKGYVQVHSRGSHFYLLPPGGGQLVSIPVHADKILKPKTLKSILKQAGLTTEDLTE